MRKLYRLKTNDMRGMTMRVQGTLAGATEFVQRCEILPQKQITVWFLVLERRLDS